FGKRELAAENHIDLPEMGSTQVIPRQVSERTGLWDRESRGIKQCTVLVEVRIDARNEVRTTCGASRAAGGCVDHSSAAGCRCGEDSSCCVGINDVRTRDENVHRKSAASVGDAADFPITQNRFCSARQSAGWNRIHAARVEIVAFI